MKIIEVTEENFKEKVLESKAKVLVDFYATWCGPCKMMASVIDTIKDELQGYEICKIDVDKCPNLSREYGVMSIPNLFIFENGKVIKNEMGFKTAEELKEFLNL